MDQNQTTQVKPVKALSYAELEEELDITVAELKAAKATCRELQETLEVMACELKTLKGGH